MTEGKFTYSIVLVDNDRNESARLTLDQFRETPAPELSIISLSPNKALLWLAIIAVSHATGDYVAFIDDDEVPPEDWLLKMYTALIKSRADGVLGPVKPRFAVMPPVWALKAGIFDRPNSQDYPSGLVLHWSQTGTGNALIQRRIFDELEGPFQTDFSGGGEDIDFFRRAMNKGRTFIWCADAIAYETIPAKRTASLSNETSASSRESLIGDSCRASLWDFEVCRRLWCIYDSASQSRCYSDGTFS